MNAYQPIIDVTPVEHSNDRKSPHAEAPSPNGAASHHAPYQQPSWQTPYSSQSRGGANAPFSTTYVYGTSRADAASKTAGSAIAGLVQIVAGTGLVLIGIPMLILPGPGLLAILGGIALASNGLRTLFG